MFTKVLLLAVCAIVVVCAVQHEVHHPQPYKFGYTIKDKHGEQHREEVSDGHNVVKGSYGFTDDRGIHRRVDYVADKGGFRAHVKTNEPGTANQNPAAVKMESSAHGGAGYGIGGGAGVGGVGYGIGGAGLGGAGLGGAGLGGAGLGGAGLGGVGLGGAGLGGIGYGIGGAGLGGVGYGIGGAGLGGLGYGIGGAGLGGLGYGMGGAGLGGFGYGIGGAGLGYGAGRFGLGDGLMSRYDSRYGAY